MTSLYLVSNKANDKIFLMFGNVSGGIKTWPLQQYMLSYLGVVGSFLIFWEILFLGKMHNIPLTSREF